MIFPLKNKLIVGAILVLLLSGPGVVSAQIETNGTSSSSILASSTEGLPDQERGIVVSPAIIDEKASPGDILKYEIRIKNESAGPGKADIYAVVNDLNEESGSIEYEEVKDLRPEASIVRWIEFSRGVIELMPGEEKTEELQIDINSTAKPGKYFARIAFPSGSNRPKAEENLLTKSFAQLLINIEIKENLIEKSQISAFVPLSTVFLTPPALFDIKLDNSGNSPVTPLGSVYIYDRRGREIAQIEANENAESVAAGETWEKRIAWQEVKGIGKFKAKLELEYGEKDKRDLQDAVFFWYFPWQFLLALFIATFLLLAILVTWIFRHSYTKHQPVQRAPILVRRSHEPSKDIVNLKK